MLGHNKIKLSEVFDNSEVYSSNIDDVAMTIFFI